MRYISYFCESKIIEIVATIWISYNFQTEIRYIDTMVVNDGECGYYFIVRFFFEIFYFAAGSRLLPHWRITRNIIRIVDVFLGWTIVV